MTDPGAAAPDVPEQSVLPSAPPPAATTPPTFPVSDVLAALDLPRKAQLLQGADAWHTLGLPEFAITGVTLHDGPNGVRKHLPQDAETMDGHGQSVPATCFSSASTLAASWDPDLARRVGHALGVECRRQGVDLLLGPGVNIQRNPLCGRNFEYFSEDPVLAGALGAGWIDGLQGTGVGASLKHFAVNSQEDGRHWISSDVDERSLREIYLWAFEHIVRHSSPWTVMCAYNRLNGVHCSQNRTLLTEILRDEWGYDGLVVSDWGAVHERVAALRAGLDLEMPNSGDHTTNQIVAAVRSGFVSAETLDRSCRRVLELSVRRDAASRTVLRDEGAHALAANHTLAVEAAARGTVLLRNEPVDGRPVLPVTTAVEPLGRAAPSDGLVVIGELARTPRYQGGGSSHVTPTRLETAAGSLAALLGHELPFAAGYRTVDAHHPEGPEGWTVDPDPDPALVAEAAEVARSAGTVLLFVGLPEWWEVEGRDRRHLRLPTDQLAVIEAVTAVNPRVVVVVSSGSPVQLEPWQSRTAAVVLAGLGGQGGGRAIADVLLGLREPTGRLAQTIPLRLEDAPSFLSAPGEQGHVRHAEGVFVGYRWYDARRLAVSYPFGFGLGYTTFTLSDLAATPGDEGWDLRLIVANTGSRRGAEVIQAYVGYADDAQPTVAQPPNRLRAFSRVELGPGESAPVHLRISTRDISYWDAREHGWRVDDADLVVRVGTSSRNLPLEATLRR